MRELTDTDEFVELIDGDLLCALVAQGFTGASRAWASDDGRAIAASCPDLARRDRLAVHGSIAAAVGLVGLVLEEVGPSFRPIGDRRLIHSLADMIELTSGQSLRTSSEFGWMERREPLPDNTTAAHWLRQSEENEIGDLLALAAPTSDAQPGDPGVDGWAGIRDDHGRLVAVAALAWSAPTVGYLCGVATHPDARGRGLARQVCTLVAGDAIVTRGAVGLMVDDDNTAAIGLYRSLGLSYRPISAAYVHNGL
ncbi:GNAT family N-acetyltransferase [Microlunatus soli]|uniref:Acetyltransferase (GNAT) family protein n=1 Tax=Microlunatus soli TaxID=630515 RepID=A0A1H1Z323_9ACTN|nr:GNAT family N-acetyltransferase [Microlunatus soli]SDT28017.1 Acetyltransferase (GNAT) family protein [Microlunatus soli]